MTSTPRWTNRPAEQSVTATKHFEVTAPAVMQDLSEILDAIDRQATSIVDYCDLPRARNCRADRLREAFSIICAISPINRG